MSLSTDRVHPETLVGDPFAAAPRHDTQDSPVRLYACAGCAERFPRRELIELHEDNHDNLTYFHGDQLCGECADNAGVEGE